MTSRAPRFLSMLLATSVMVASLSAQADEAKAAGDDTVYLFTSFRDNGEDGLRFLWSEDGYQWEEVRGKFLKPRVGPSQLMRDPSLLRGPDGTYRLVWTTGWKGDQGFGYAHSKDLVHWSPQQFVPVMEHEPTTVNVWAPELFYDEPNKRYIICWASTIPGRFPDHDARFQDVCAGQAVLRSRLQCDRLRDCARKKRGTGVIFE
jgi:hypothetical protein